MRQMRVGLLLLLGLACATAAPVPTSAPPEEESLQQAQVRCRATATGCEAPTVIVLYEPGKPRPCQGIAVRDPPMERPVRQLVCACLCDSDASCSEGQRCARNPGDRELPAQQVCQRAEQGLATGPTVPCVVH